MEELLNCDGIGTYLHRAALYALKWIVSYVADVAWGHKGVLLCGHRAMGKKMLNVTVMFIRVFPMNLLWPGPY